MEHEKREHAVCAASAAERWLNCPGSIKLSQRLPDEPRSPYALEGTRAHELAERILRKWEEDERCLNQAWVDTLRPEYRDTEFETGDGRMWSMVDYAMTYVNVCLEQVSQFSERPTVRMEHRLTLDKDLGLFGTGDFVCTGKQGGEWVGVVADFKYGTKRVKAERNLQLSYYAAALRKNSKRPLERIKTVIVQPKVKQFYDEAWYTASELDEVEKELKSGAEKAVRQVMGMEPVELQRGSWCWFCPARSVCPEMDKARAEKAAEEFEDECDD